MDVIFTNTKGESITFSDAYPFRLISLEGVGSIEADVQMQKSPFQDGMTFVDTLYEPRDMLLTAMIKTDTEAEFYEKRSEISSVFNAKLGVGILRVEYAGGVKEIGAVCDIAPSFKADDGRRNHLQRTVISLICPNPFWTDVTDSSADLAQYVGGLSFSTTFPLSFGEAGDTLIAENNGDVDAPLLLTFDGPALNPKLENVTTGEEIEIQQEIASGESVRINTAFGQNEVTRIKTDGTEENVLHWLTDDSELFKLITGENDIRYTEDSGAGDAGSLTIKYRNRFVGI